MFGLNVVKSSGRVAPIWVTPDVALGQSGVSLIGIEIGVAVLELETLWQCRVRFPGQFDHGFIDLKTSVVRTGVTGAFLNPAKAVSGVGKELEQVAKLPGICVHGVAIVEMA